MHFLEFKLFIENVTLFFINTHNVVTCSNVGCILTFELVPTFSQELIFTKQIYTFHRVAEKDTSPQRTSKLGVSLKHITTAGLLTHQPPI